MKNLKTFCLLILSLGLAVSLPQRAIADEDDPPDRAARLAYAQGSVSFQPAGTQDWVTAVVNRPITTGDKLWTDRDSRAELQIGSAAIRLGSQTGFSFLNLNDNMAQIQLNEGVVNLHVRHVNQNDSIEVDTPNLAFSIVRPGDYRLEVNEAGDSTAVTVRDGEGEVTGGGQALTIHANQRATFSGTDQLAADVEGLGDYDNFDRWARDRDVRFERSPSARYVSRDVIGYQDLDDYGDWRTTPEYGAVWFPRSVDAGWAPYREGHWAWVSPWGWTWVDDEPWGFAPFHYGRWASVGGRWGWCPGPIAVARPVYAPALVAWVGGEHFGVSIGIGGGGGGVGWFPLGPREVYVPPYRVSRAYVSNVNVTNTTVNNTYVTNVYNNTINNNTSNIKYVNRTAPNAVTATSQTAFAAGQPVRKNIVKVDQRQVAQARVVTRAAVVPQQRSVVGAAPVARAKPPAAVQTRAVVAKTAPPPAPVSFAAQQKAIQANGGRPLGRQEVRRLQPQAAKPAAAPAQVRVVKPTAKPVPVESVARAKPAQPGQPVKPGQQPNNPAPAAQPAPRPGEPAARPGQPAPQPQQQPRPNQPPSAEPNKAQPQRPSENQPGAVTPNRPDRPPSAQPNKAQPPAENRPAPAQPNKAQPQRPSENRPGAVTPNRSDRPPSAQPNKAQPPRPGENRPPTSAQPKKAEPQRPSESRPSTATPNRSDRPPSAQPNKAEPPPPNRATPPRNPSENRPTSPNRPERPAQQNQGQPERNRGENRPSNVSPNRPERPPSAEPKQSQPSRNPGENRPSSANRPERPPSSQPNQAQPPRNRGENRPSNANPNRPELPRRDSRDADVERKRPQKTPQKGEPTEDSRPQR